MMISAEWSWEPAIVVPLLSSAVLYGAGVRSAWMDKSKRGVRGWEAGAFAAGLIVLVVALVSPLHEASEQFFSAHMVQHELLMVVAAPLLVLGRPAFVMLWAVPIDARRLVGTVTRARGVHRIWRIMSRPVDAWLVHAVVIWVWHVPALFQAALRSEAVHGLQHVSFLGSALLFWWALIYPHRRAALGLSIVYLFTTAVHTAVLGALLTFARSPWYPEYAARAGAGAAGASSALEDQQLAGLVMWIPASFVYLVAALLILRRWLRDSDWSAARGERVGLAT